MPKIVSEEEIIELFRNIDVLPSTLRSKAINLIVALYEGKWPGASKIHFKYNPVKEMLTNYPFLKIRRGTSESHLRRFKKRGREIFAFLDGVMNDSILSDEFKDDITAILYKHIPLWRLIRITLRSTKKSKSLLGVRNVVVYQLVDLYMNVYPSKKKAYYIVSKIISVVGHAMSSENVRSIYESELKKMLYCSASKRQ